MTATTNTLKVARKVWETARAGRNDRGVYNLETKVISKMIRERLSVEFPGVKFSVTTRDCTCINVGWTDGPYAKQVGQITNEYKFGGFDGSIDMDYQSKRWLLPDGRLEFCSSTGTEDSRGTVPAGTTDCPEPGAVIVDSVCKYIFCSREQSDEYMDHLAREVCDYYGGMEYDPATPLHKHPIREDLRHNGIFSLSRLIDQYETRKAREMIA